MNIQNYLEKFDKNKITIVGPLYSIDDKKRPIKDPCIFVDGGTKFKKPGVGISIGDGDSFEGKLDIVLPKEKDFSDLSFVLSQIGNYKNISMLGFLGKRVDHQLINLGEIYNFLKNKTLSTVFFDDQIIALSQGDFELDINSTFSVISFNDQIMTIDGDCKYKLKDQKISAFSSHGLSNIGFGKIRFLTNNPIFIYLVDALEL